MGSLCCVAARPHGTSSTSRDWPLTPTDPFWCANASFSLAPSDQFYRHSSFPSYGSRSSIDGMSLNSDSSDSLESANNSQGSESWERNGIVTIDSGFEGIVSNFSSPDNGFEMWQEQAVNDEGFVRVPAPRPLVFTSFSEETSLLGNSDHSPMSSSSVPSVGEYEFSAKYLQFAPRSLPTVHRSFISTPVHPLSFSDKSPSRSGSTSSVVDSTEGTDTAVTLTPGPRCGICKRFLSRKSPWGKHKLVHTFDMPVVSILSCTHVYHAECLDLAASKLFKHDPACPVCDKSEKDNGNTEQWAICKLKNGFPRLRSAGEGPSTVWRCAENDDMGMLRKNLLNRQLSQKDDSKSSNCCTSSVVLEGKLERNLILG